MDWGLMFKQIYFRQSRIFHSISLSLSVAPCHCPLLLLDGIMHSHTPENAYNAIQRQIYKECCARESKNSSNAQKIQERIQKMRGHYYIDIVFAVCRCTAKYNIIKLRRVSGRTAAVAATAPPPPAATTAKHTKQPNIQPNAVNTENKKRSSEVMVRTLPLGTSSVDRYYRLDATHHRKKALQE